ncbi:hypothetical protein EXE30_06835 [Acinetobacter halotolerans]|uniref:Scaffolding protein n=1 Tax=Acinetobacter halotolerans TaxID=1752076 RepID=A0A4Q6XA54_9GAMM|nr:hypothetical protein [Acinetobacter halotolerans]RZF53685.1 hypothetical protein EXE30_06835 [Acinetobacter halotolerans]
MSIEEEQTVTPEDVETTQAPEQEPDLENGSGESAENQETNGTPEDGEVKKEEAAQAKRQSAIDRRFAQLTWEKNEAIRKAQALEQQYGKPEELKEPSMQDFDSIADWQNALSTYLTQKAEQDTAKRFEQQRQEQFQIAQAAKLETAEAEFAKTHPDYQNRIGGLVHYAGGELPQHLSDAVFELGDDAPAVLYELSKDPTDVMDLINLSPMAQLIRIGEVRASIKNNPKPTPKAPQIPQPVSLAQSKSNAKKDIHKMSDSDFLRERGLY